MALKQVIIVRQDLKLPKGKLASQCSHASVEAVLKSNRDVVDDWRKEGMKKSILKVKNLNELLSYERIAKNYRLKNALIKDAAKTFLKEPKITCLAIGPSDEMKIDKITGKLKLL
ncbi:aminoacyl-tRNA hydrolase [archaeon]|nr:aminoacyl-tRNA hydrolase [archaeon]|tara:strand:+ start:8397 stop:8741 length:345 start_codon:yes stop_codon:yes gene_type:complete